MLIGETSEVGNGRFVDSFVRHPLPSARVTLSYERRIYNNKDQTHSATKERS